MTGDGSFGMSVGELETITRLGLPIVIIQCSNGTFGWIKELQHLYHGDRYFGVDFNPVDYAAIARGFGFCAAQVTDPNDVDRAVREAVADGRPYPRHCYGVSGNGDAAGGGLDHRRSRTAGFGRRAAVTEQVPVILDVDTGTDDALALGYAVASPRTELVAVTTVAGNVGVEKTTANTLAVLDWLGAGDVPVHRGASRPLVRPHRDAVYFHDEGGLGGCTASAVDTFCRGRPRARGSHSPCRLRPRELTLVTLGPLTNLAIALNVEPNLPELLKSVVVMGGAYSVPGNTTPAAEFNILVDPEAAEQVFTARFPTLTTVGLDVTERVALTRDDWDAVNAALNHFLPSATLLREVGKFAFSRLVVESSSHSTIRFRWRSRSTRP